MANQTSTSDSGTVIPQKNQNLPSPEPPSDNLALREYLNRVYTETKNNLDKINKEIIGQNKKLDDQKVYFDEQAKIIKGKIRDLDGKEIRILEALGVFFALFTFISTNVQIFSRITDLSSAIIFSASIFCMLILILIIFTFLLNRREETYIAWHFLVFFTFLTLGLLSIDWLLKQKFPLNHVENTPDFNNAVDKRFDEKVILDNLIKASPTTTPIILPTQ